MSEHSSLPYEKMVQDALLGVVRDTLRRIAKHGLPGNHHFYIGFRTDHPDVIMASYLREAHSKEITVVLQYQFWDLKVFENKFCVSLSFNDMPEHLEIPFDAITSFVDPAVRFGLQFTPEIPEAMEETARPSQPTLVTNNDKTSEDGDDNVVRLDFRKKK